MRVVGPTEMRGDISWIFRRLLRWPLLEARSAIAQSVHPLDVEGHGDQAPLAFDLCEAAQQELSKSDHRFDDAEDWFDVIAAGAVVPNKKPAPDIYFYAMEKLGVSAAECLAFEDSENGLRSAQGAGLCTLVTVSHYSRGQDFSGAALVLDQLGEPDHPFEVLAGDADDYRFVTVDQLRELHAQTT